jgi:Planctomycete cytochrome C
MMRNLRGLGYLTMMLGLGTTLGDRVHASSPVAEDRSRPQGQVRSSVLAGTDRPEILLAQKSAAKKKKGATKKSAPAAGETTKTAPEVATMPANASGLSFSRDIAPILVQNCTRCHDAKKRSGKLDLTSFEKLMAGSDKEKVIVPGQPEESHLVLRIQGEETPKMPQGNNNNLGDVAIEKIANWVKAGAKLDTGIDPRAALETYASTPEQLRIAELKKLSPEERDKMVEKVGLERWKQASPKNTPEVTPSAHFLIFSTMPKDRAAAVSKSMEAAYSQLQTILSRQGSPALDWAEKTSLFLFNDPAPLIEFIRSLESREIEPGVKGTANFATKEPYVAVVDPLGGREDPSLASGTRKSTRSRRGSEEDAGSVERSATGLLAEQMATGVLKNSGKVPDWLSLGVGVYFAAAVDSKSSYVHQVRKNAYVLWQQGWTAKANEGLGGEGRLEDTRAIGYAIVDWMAHDGQARPRFPAFVQAMADAGERKLDDVIDRVFSIRRQDFLQFSGEWIGNRYGRTR